jgi:hypothetical protein
MEFTTTLVAKQDLVLVENLVNQAYDPVTVQRQGPVNIGDWVEKFCAPIFMMEVKNPDTSLWGDWMQVQMSLMERYMQTKYPSSDPIWQAVPSWISQ